MLRASPKVGPRPASHEWVQAATAVAGVQARGPPAGADEPAWSRATAHGFFVILNVAVGGAFPAALGGGPTAATASGRSMFVDYVAVSARRPT